MLSLPYLHAMQGGLFWAIAGIVFIIIALLLSWHTIGVYPFRSRPVAHWLQEEPDQIVWVYPHLIENMPFGIKLFNITMLHFHLLNGDNLQLSCTPAEAYHLMDQLRDHMPHACFGYSQEKEFMYANDPEMLLRTTEE